MDTGTMDRSAISQSIMDQSDSHEEVSQITFITSEHLSRVRSRPYLRSLSWKKV